MRCIGRVARLLQELAEEIAVETSEGEPLRAAGCGGDDVDVLGTKSSFANERVGIGAGEESERTHSLNASRAPAATVCGRTSIAGARHGQ